MSETWKRVSGWTEDGDDGLPKFGKKARRWFMRLLRAKLEANRFDIKDDELEPVLARFAANPMPFITWNDAEDYHGRNYSNGAWKIDWNVVVYGVAAALNELRAEAESARFPTLDDWLRAEVKGTLDSTGRMGGSAKLPKKLRRELQAAARARRKNRARICRTCHTEFTPTCNRALRCKKCIDSDSPAPRRNSRQ
jgi:hypothetical protein